MSKITVSQLINPPVYSLFRRNGRMEQVKVTRFISEGDGIYKNEIQCPDGTVLEVANSLLLSDRRFKRVVGHPDAV